MAGSLWQQLRWLIYRNILLKYRNKIQTVQEILLPVYFVVMLGAFVVGNPPKTQPVIASFPTYNLSQFGSGASICPRGLAATPNNSEVQDVMDNVTDILGLSVPYLVYDSEQAMVDAHKNESISCGIVFSGDITDMNYTLRMPYGTVPNIVEDFTSVGACRNGQGLDSWNCPANQYLFSGFTLLQSTLDHVLIKMKTNSSLTSPHLMVEMMAKDSYRASTTTFQTLSGIYLILAFSPFIGFLLVNLVTEKEKKIKEGMKMMGLRDAAFWLSWIIVYVAMLLVICTLCTLLAWAMRIFPNSNPFLIFLIFFLYGLSMVSAGFMLSPFFNKAIIAGAVSSLTSIFVSLLYLPVVLTSAIPIAVQWILCMLSPFAMALACNQAILLESSYGNEGAQFDNMWVGDLPLAGCLIMLSVDAVLYLLLAIYFEQVVQAEYGKRKPLCFCFMPSYWKSENRIDEETRILSLSQNTISDYDNGIQADVEPVSTQLKSRDGIRIRNLVKKFPAAKGGEKPVIAVNGISLDIYEGEITCLLGHNGAGKSTLIGALTGMLPPTSGGATIYGREVSDPNAMSHIRTITGVCPQQDIVFDHLTAREHLKVYAGLKGIPDEDIDAQVDKVLQDVDLHKNGDADKVARHLSGGQKRKLCVGMAMIGDPKVLFLDEPSSGMDPYSRRHLWSLLKNNRKGRVIVLCTHFMDEADILADRKAIITKGSLRCYGSSLFLKNKFGIGYHLGMVVEQGKDTGEITDFVKSRVEGAELGRSYGMELTYTLPLQDVSQFADLFSALEEPQGDVTKSKALGIQTYGVSMTTLEEVFLKLGEEQEMEDEDVNNVETANLLPGHEKSQGNKGNPASFNSLSLNIEERGVADNEQVQVNQTALHSSQLCTRKIQPGKYQFSSLCKMLLLLTMRNGAVYFTRIIMPSIFMVVGILMINIQLSTDDALNPTQRTLQPSMYLALKGDTITTKKTEFLYHNSTDSDLSTLLTEFDNLDLQYDMYNLTELVNRDEAYNMAVDVLQWKTVGMDVMAKMTALYNDTAQHSIPVIMNILSNAIYGVLSDDITNITISSQAFPKVDNTLGFSFGLLFVLFFSLALIGVSASFAPDLVRDRELKIKAQLRISGLRTQSYWLSHFAINISSYCIPTIVSLILILAFQIESFTQSGAFLCLVILYIVYLPASTIFVYCNSFMFDKFETCSTAYPWIANTAFYLFGAPVIVLDLLQYPEVAAALHLVFCIIYPHYGIVGGFYYIDRVYQVNALQYGPSDVPFEDYFKLDSYLVPTFVCIILGNLLYLLLLRFLEARATGTSFSNTFTCCNSNTTAARQNFDTIQDEDDDVNDEREKVANLTNISSMEKPPSVVVKGIRKTFSARGGKKKKGKNKDKSNETDTKVAVRNLSLAVERGEVFGLLGPNGAGKTTSMNIITADVGADCGQVSIGGQDVDSPVSDAFLLMGYCPQVNPLWEDLTTREHIEMYAAVKGIHPDDRKEIADCFLSALKMAEHADKRAKTLSGGTKRKLCFLISMLGEPGIVLLDEPSTGLDPSAKRFLWDTITSSFVGNRGAILTTHSMEEADAVCSRVGIMTLGELRCIGSTQHLKDKYGSGYVLECKLKVEEGSDSENEELAQKMTELREFVLGMFPSAQVMESFNERVLYKIPKDAVTSLAAVFSALEKEKLKLGMEEYSFTQSTLEQVFLEFAKVQEEMDELDVTDKAILTRQKSLQVNQADPSPC